MPAWAIMAVPVWGGRGVSGCISKWRGRGFEDGVYVPRTKLN